MIKIHLFDMDDTLISNDCDVSWKSFTVRHGLAPESALQEAADFFEDYKRGELDLEKFTLFQLREFIGRTAAEMAELADAHFREFVLPTVRQSAIRQVREAKGSGAVTAIITSTNSVLARPVAEFFGVDELHGTELEIGNGRFTGRVKDTYAAGQGKVEIAGRILSERGISAADAAAYGDSINDLPLLSMVGHPRVVTPGAKLLEIARSRNWPVFDWAND